MKPYWMVLALSLHACGDEQETAPVQCAVLPTFHELKPYIRESLARGEELLDLGEWPAEADPEHVRGLVTMVSGSDPGMREIALEEAAAEGDSFVQELVRITGHTEDPAERRQAALQLLGRLDTPRSAEALLVLVETAEEPWMRANAAWRLGDTSQDWVLPRLYLRLKYETDENTVIWLAKTLAHFGNYSGMLALSNVANQSRDETTRASAAARMQEIVDGAGFDFESVEELWRDWTTNVALPPFRPQRSDRYDLEILRLIARFAEFQLRGVDDSRFVFEGLGYRAAALLALALQDENVYVRVHSAQALQRMGPRGEPATERLVGALADPELAPHAAAALGAIRDTQAIPALVECVYVKERPNRRLAAARALGSFRAEEAEPALEALRDLVVNGETEELRQAAAESLAHLGHGDEVAALLCDFLLSPRIEPVSSEQALRAWISGEAEAGNTRAEELLAEWDALLIPNDAIIPAAEKLASREARRTLVLEALPELTP